MEACQRHTEIRITRCGRVQPEQRGLELAVSSRKAEDADHETGLRSFCQFESSQSRAHSRIALAPCADGSRRRRREHEGFGSWVHLPVGIGAKLDVRLPPCVEWMRVQGSAGVGYKIHSLNLFDRSFC